jgi:hypothetical protein
MVHLIAGEIQIQRSSFAPKPRGDPTGHQIDRSDHTIAAIAVKNDSAGCNRFHRSTQRKNQNKCECSGKRTLYGIRIFTTLDIDYINMRMSLHASLICTSSSIKEGKQANAIMTIKHWISC